MRKILLLSLCCISLSATAQQAFFDADSLVAVPAGPGGARSAANGGDTSGQALAAPGLQLVSNQFSFTEGPAVDRRGNVFFTDQPNNQIWEYHTEGRLTLFMDSAGRSNGMYFDKKGDLISCADEHDQLWSISPERKVTVLVKNWQGSRLNGPNDLWIDPKGGIYFTDPYYQRDYWDRTKSELNAQSVYYLPAPAGKKKPTPVPVEVNLVKPNGIVGTPDGKFLYVADIVDNKTYKYQINDDGTLDSKTLFAPQGSDGMTLDTKGNLYLCGNGITVYDPSGKKIAYLPIPAKWTANLCFGGRDKKTLFITASRSVYILPMRVAGVE
jgi:gluconolactonase